MLNLGSDQSYALSYPVLQQEERIARMVTVILLSNTNGGNDVDGGDIPSSD